MGNNRGFESSSWCAVSPACRASRCADKPKIPVTVTLFLLVFHSNQQIIMLSTITKKDRLWYRSGPPPLISLCQMVTFVPQGTSSLCLLSGAIW